MQHATGLTYRELVAQRIGNPLGLTSTYMDIDDNVRRVRAKGYRCSKNGFVADEAADLLPAGLAGAIVTR